MHCLTWSQAMLSRAQVSAFKSCCSAASIAAAPGFDADDEDMSVALAAQLEEDQRGQLVCFRSDYPLTQNDYLRKIILK